MNKEQLAIVGLAACLVFDTAVHRRNRKRFKRLVDNSSDIATYAVQSDRENDYLRHLLDEHEIPVTEFDLIVLQTFNREG